MKTIFSFLLFIVIASSNLFPQQPVFQDDDLTPELFSNILKDEWTYLKDATEQLIKETGNRDEFETTPEFQARAQKSRRSFVEKLNAHIKEIKLDRRVFGVWLKANLISYDADAEVYSLGCNTTIKAPYEIPTVSCVVPKNNLICIADSIEGGYRTSHIYLKIDPVFKWSVARNIAQQAKANSDVLYFKINFIVNLNLDSSKNRGLIEIVPKELLIMNQNNKMVYYKELININQ